MSFTIREKADSVGTFRYISVHLMETLARWVPSTPELEGKLLFGRHLWDFAQHADALGKRTAELRAALHYSLAPLPRYQEVLELVREQQATGDRIAAFYDGLLPDLEARYRRYLNGIDPINDEPTVRIIERLLADLHRLSADRARLSAERPELTRQGADAAARVAALAAPQLQYVAFRPRVESPAELLA